MARARDEGCCLQLTMALAAALTHSTQPQSFFPCASEKQHNYRPSSSDTHSFGGRQRQLIALDLEGGALDVRLAVAAEREHLGQAWCAPTERAKDRQGRSATAPACRTVCCPSSCSVTEDELAACVVRSAQLAVAQLLNSLASPS